MDESVIRYNAKKIYTSGDLDKKIFTVDSKGKLHTISKFNYLGRFINWCRGKLSKESNREKTCRVFDATIQGMIDLSDPSKHTDQELRKNYVDQPLVSSPGYHYVNVITPITKSEKYGHLAVNASETLEKMRNLANLPDIDI